MKMRPFNLEEALNGAKVVTRDGREVTQLTKFKDANYFSLAGVLSGSVITWSESGSFTEFMQESPIDLFLAVEQQRAWINVHQMGDSFWVSESYNSRERAVIGALLSELPYIKTIEITDEL